MKRNRPITFDGAADAVRNTVRDYRKAQQAHRDVTDRGADNPEAEETYRALCIAERLVLRAALDFGEFGEDSLRQVPSSADETKP